jgi:hypothetical protein
MNRQDFVRLLERVSAGDAPTARDAGKQIVKALKFKRVDNLRELAKDYWAVVENRRSDMKPCNLAELASLMSIFGWGLRTESGISVRRLEMAEDLVLDAMILGDGALRERARHGADYLRLALFGPFRAEDSNRIKKYLARLESLIEEHRPIQKLPYVDEMKPSVFKTLVIHWYDLGMGVTGEKYVNVERARQLNIPIYSYWDDDWLEESMPSYEEVLENIWKDQQQTDFKVINKIMKDLEASAYDRFVRSLTWYGRDVSIASKIRERARAEGGRAGYELFFELVRPQTLMVAGTDEAMTEFAELARGVQALTGHIVSRNASSEPTSSFLINCGLAKINEGRNLPKSWQQLLVITYEAHKAVDELRAQINILEDPTDTLKRYFSSDELARMKKDTIEDNLSLADAAHYMLDLTIMAEPWSANRRNPKQFAAVAWYLIAKANEKRRPTNYTPLAELGGWKGASTLYSIGNRVNSSIAYMVDGDRLPTDVRFTSIEDL